METVSVVEPLPVIEAGLKLQALSRGKPVQEAGVKLMVPLKPGWPVTVSTMLPLSPCLAIVIVEGSAKARSKSGCTFTVVAGEIDPM